MRIPSFAHLTGWLLLAAALATFAGGQGGGVTALGVIGSSCLAVALLRLTRRTPGGGRIASILVLLAGLLGLGELQGLDLGGPMPPVVLAVLLIGGAASVVAAWETGHVRRLALGIGGFALTAIGITSIFVRVVAEFDLMGARGFGTIPMELALASMLFGVVAVALAWNEGTGETIYPEWTPVAVAIAGVGASILLWRTAVLREEVQIRQASEHEAQAGAQGMRRIAEQVGAALQQFVELGDTTLVARDPAAALIQLDRSVPATVALALIDSTGMPTTAIPATADLAVIRSTVPPRAVHAPRAGRAPVAYLQPAEAGDQFVVHATRCRAGACKGGVAAVVTFADLATRIATNRPGWNLDALPPGSTPSTDGYRAAAEAAIGDVSWVFVARPSPRSLGTMRSAVPEIALILGFVVTGLLALTVRIGASAWENARVVERMRISSAISRATDAVWEWEVPSGRLHRSDGLWRHLGYDPSAAMRTLDEWLALIHPDDRDRVAEALTRLGDAGADDFEAEYRVRTQGGEWHAVVDRGRIIERDGGGSPQRVMGITADVTQARRAEQELREVEALSSMGRVAARVAHEINNPLAGIHSAFLLIKDAVPTNHPHRHYVGAIEREVDRIASVTRMLYEVYRPEREAGASSLATITNDAVALLRQVNRAANVDIDVHLDGVPPVVPVSGGLLRQIVYALVQNAVDASPVGSTVDVHGRVEHRNLVLEVRDQGAGVPAEARQQIFDPFFTTKDASSRTSGMGMGLTMVARSVAAAQGTIEVTDAPGGGARFVVRLPLTNGGSAA